MGHSELVAGLCTALTFTCCIQIIMTTFLAFAFAQFMPVLHCNLATAAGVISGLVTVPTVIQLRTSQISSHVARKYGYANLYKKLAIGICAMLQTITWICTIYDLTTAYDMDTFLRAMMGYSRRQTTKSIVDNVQWFLQCCGSEKYSDWYQLDWSGFVFENINTRRKRSIKYVLLEDADDYPDISPRNDIVPFSCCSEFAKTACIHQNLEEFGTYTINTAGCTKKLIDTKQSILWSEFIIYTVCLLLEITILLLLLRTSDSVYDQEQQTSKTFHQQEARFSEFLNQQPIADLARSRL